jgi:hypothetical protein
VKIAFTSVRLASQPRGRSIGVLERVAAFEERVWPAARFKRLRRNEYKST